MTRRRHGPTPPPVTPGEAYYLRTLVLAGRAMHRAAGSRCVSRFECVACAMPHATGRGRCELCGGTAFQPLVER